MNRLSALLLSLLLATCRSSAVSPVVPATPTTSATPVIAAAGTRPIVLLISIDGFRHDYLRRFAPPNLTRLAANGVRAEGLIPQFPSKTFPNHYTLVTGLRLGHHGIVSNNMVDPALPGRFSMSNRDAVREPRWWGGEPIWNTAERQGLVAGAMFWPGSEAAVGGRQATYWTAYEDKMPHRQRIDQLLAWLKQPPERQPSFLTLYFSDVDNAGHEIGPEPADPTELREAIARVDASLGELMTAIDALSLSSRVNYVVVSDHGMSQVSANRLIKLDDYIDTGKHNVLDAGPVLAISPKDGDPETLYRALSGKHPHMKVYRKADLPKRFALSTHPRVLPVMAIADDGWYITSKSEMEGWAKSGTMSGGAHGYDPKNPSMWGLFIASGPNVRGGGRVLKPFENIHVYDFMCALLGIVPAPNDGDPKVTSELVARSARQLTRE